MTRRPLPEASEATILRSALSMPPGIAPEGLTFTFVFRPAWNVAVTSFKPLMDCDAGVSPVPPPVTGGAVPLVTRVEVVGAGGVVVAVEVGADVGGSGRGRSRHP